MRIPRWSFDAEIFTILKSQGLRAVEVPIQWADQAQTKVRLGRDVVRSFWELLRILYRRARGGYR
jgi:hypothetical protein